MRYREEATCACTVNGPCRFHDADPPSVPPQGHGSRRPNRSALRPRDGQDERLRPRSAPHASIPTSESSMRPSLSRPNSRPSAAAPTPPSRLTLTSAGSRWGRRLGEGDRDSLEDAMHRRSVEILHGDGVARRYGLPPHSPRYTPSLRHPRHHIPESALDLYRDQEGNGRVRRDKGA